MGEKESNRRIFSVDRHVGMAGSGLYADVRQLADIAMTECANYKSDYGSPIPIKSLVDRVSAYCHAYTLYSSVRPRNHHHVWHLLRLEWPRVVLCGKFWIALCLLGMC